LLDLAKKENAGWVRVDPENNQILELIKNNISLPIKKAPHDMQPREILVMDIAKSEEELLTDMKSKTRYNIKLAEKKGVKITSSWNMEHETWNKKYINEFVRLIKLTEKRKSIKFHSANYYQKMLEMIPGDILKLYVAEYNGKIIAANLVIFFGDTATYLHGATDNEYRNVMAPYLLQWQAIEDAKKAGFTRYDFGGICSGPTALDRNDLQRSDRYNSWSGITKFKLGFAPETEPTRFLGSFDLVVNAPKYFIYRLFSQLKSIF
jgi:lipid II:glycine glycyltransferase (peptidoglycan interpeptide bridge formation enzyme)